MSNDHLKIYVNISVDPVVQCHSPIGIVHVLLSDFVGLGVHIDGVLSLGGHELGPDDAALLCNLFLDVRHIIIIIGKLKVT